MGFIWKYRRSYLLLNAEGPICYKFMAATSAKEKNDEKWCPACSKSDSGKWNVILRQINAEEAVYVCENPDCTYPVGYEVDFIKRPVPCLLEKKEKPESISRIEDSINNLGNSTKASLQSFQPEMQQQPNSSDILHGFCEENSWSSALDSLLDPEVAAFLDSAQ